ncbi:MAG: penicillin acylase family protein [Deltaproteobacteria bacterium]|nr:penicillin acylase family protein [Deltaproteobacteria bacterium]
MTKRSVGFGTVLVLLACLLPACSGRDEPVVDPGPRLPTAPVEILVDDRGIAHIYAQNDEDLFFAYGYQIASDRLLQLDMFRRFAYGRLSEVLGAFGHGSAGADTLTDDRFARIFNWQHWGKLDAELMKNEEPEHYRLTSAWVAGINKRIAEVNAGQVPLPFGFGPDELDYRPEAWDPVDPYVVQKMAGFDPLRGLRDLRDQAGAGRPRGGQPVPTGADDLHPTRRRQPGTVVLLVAQTELERRQPTRLRDGATGSQSCPGGGLPDPVAAESHQASGQQQLGGRWSAHRLGHAHSVR